MKISLITVCHKSKNKIVSYVSSFLEYHLNANNKIEYEFVFVENSGESGLRQIVQPLIDSGFDVLVLDAANEGFGSACNLGAKHSTGELFVFANPDIRFLSNLDPLAMFVNRPAWGTIRQLTPSGRMYSIDLFPENKGLFFELLKLHQICNRFFRFFLGKSYVVGSFMVIERELFQRSGGFDPCFFLYYEEAELCRRLQAMAGPPGLVTRASVFHEGFGSHDSHDEVLRHEANGFLTYCRVTAQLNLIHRRLRTLRLMGFVSRSSCKKFLILKNVVANGVV